MVEFTVSFSLVRCACGAERQAAQQCPNCARISEDEVDENLKRRKAIVDRASRPTPDREGEPLLAEEAFRVLRPWFDSFVAACRRVEEVSDDEATTGLRNALGDLGILHRRVENTRRLRPLYALWDTVDEVLSAYDEIGDAYLSALVAPTIDEAKKEGIRGQAALDRAAFVLDRFNQHSEWSERTEGDASQEEDDLVAGAEAIAALSGSSDLVSLDTQGAELFDRITGGDITCPDGFGVALRLLDFAVETSMNRPRFWAVSQTVYRQLTTHDVALRALFDDKQWRQDLASVAQEALDAGFESTAVTAASANRRRYVQSALRLAARQIERIAHPLLATILAIANRRPYASERARDIGALLDKAVQQGHGDLLLGLDLKLRDADAHREFEIDEGGVRLTGTRGNLDYLTDDELVDATLAGTESIAAMYWGTIAALVAVGADSADLGELLQIEITDEGRIKFVLLLNGWHNVEVTREGSAFTVHGDRDKKDKIGVIASIVSVLPEECETLTLTANDEDGTHVAFGPAPPVRNWRKIEQEPERMIAFTLATAAWMIDGSPLVSKAHAEKVFAVNTLQALNPEVPTRASLKSLRSLLDGARAIDSQELAAAIASALRLRRVVAVGVEVNSSQIENVTEALGPWLLEELPETRSDW
jgi:hypothetical protein